MKTENLRVALFYDWLNQWGGAEQVLLDILRLYPQSHLYSLIHHPKKTQWLPSKTPINTTFINKLPFNQHNPICYTPLYPLALEQFNFSAYDIVISLTTTIGHCLLTPPSTLYVCYFLNVNRYLYRTPSSLRLLKPILNTYKPIDKIFAKRPDYLLCDSKTVQERIKSAYGRSSQIVYPGVDTTYFTPNPKNQKPSGYFLLVSRLVPHKNIDLAIRAFADLPSKLVVVGEGRQASFLHRLASQNNLTNIEFLGSVSRHRLRRLYRHCKALICPQIEDFGLTPLESMACGRPVIAFGKGGITETVIEGETGTFFHQLSPTALVRAVKNFDVNAYSSAKCITQAQKFSRQNFMLHFKQTITRLWQNSHLPITTS